MSGVVRPAMDRSAGRRRAARSREHEPAGLRTWVAGAGSGLALLSLLVGLPVLFAGQGMLPHLGALRLMTSDPHAWIDRLRNPMSDAALGTTVALMAWAAWAYLVVCVALDVGARIRGRATVRMPGSRSTQALVAGLVGASLALMPVPRGAHIRLHPGSVVRAVVPATEAPERFAAPSPPGGTSPLAAGPHEELAGFFASATRLREPVPGSRPAQLDPPSQVRLAAVGDRVYVVQPGDTLWAIAARELGSPLRWREIGDRNHGLPQPDGLALTDDNWILPGWRLVLPPSTPPPSVAAVEESLEGLAPVLPDPPGSERDTPALVSEAPATLSPGPAMSSLGPSGDAARAVPSARPDGVHVPVVPIGSGVLGAAVVLLVDRMRRAQQRRRPEGLRVSLPDADIRELEGGLRAGADLSLLRDVQGALRLLWATVARDGPPPPLVAARLGGDQVEFVLDPRQADHPAPPPFRASGDGAVWTIPTTRLAEHHLGTTGPLSEDGHVLPTLVTLGADGEATLLVDLEQAGSVGVSGQDASMMLQGAIVELCTAPWSAGVDVVVIGYHGELGGLERVRRAASMAGIVPEVRRRVSALRTLAAEAGVPRISDARWGADDPCWDPLVVVCFAEAVQSEPEAARTLVELAGEGANGIAVLTGAAVEGARWSVVADGATMDLRGPDRPGLPTDASTGAPARLDTLIGRQGLRPQPSPPDLLARVDALVTAAEPSPHVFEPPARQREVDASPALLPADKTESTDEVDLAGGETPGGRPTPAPDEVRVLVLGPVSVQGAARPFARAWSLDLVVYLAMHREGATTERWTSALWPDRIPAPATVHSTASSARRALGVASTGDDHLPRAHGRLTLGPQAGSDWDDFLRLSKSADPDDWEGALALVRGRPFDGLRASDWLVLEGIQAAVESTVVDVACRFARTCLESGPPGAAKAEWSARQALLVSQYDERLYRVLLLAADLAGNPAGVETTMRELLTLVAEEVEPFDSIHPETLALYRSLSRRPAAGGRADG